MTDGEDARRSRRTNRRSSFSPSSVLQKSRFLAALEMTDGEDARRVGQGPPLQPKSEIASPALTTGAPPLRLKREREEPVIKAPDGWAWAGRCAGEPGRRCGCRSLRGRRLFSV